MSHSQKDLVLVSQRVEVQVTAGILCAVGLGTLLVAILVSGVSIGVVLGAAIGEAVFLGAFLHVLEHKRRFGAFLSSPPRPEHADQELRWRTICRQAALVAVPATVLVVLTTIGWGSIVLTPGIFLGGSLWLAMDARTVAGWERTNGLQVMKVPSLGFDWLRRRDAQFYVDRVAG